MLDTMNIQHRKSDPNYIINAGYSRFKILLRTRLKESIVLSKAIKPKTLLEKAMAIHLSQPFFKSHDGCKKTKR